MKKTFLIVLLLFAIICADGKKISKSRTSSSSRGSSRKTYNPQPTSSAAAQPSHHQPAPKPSLFGWQEKPAQSRASAPRQSQQPKQTQTHSYPSSNTGLSGNQAKQPSYPQNVQKSSVPQSASGQSHSYPSSNTGLSGTGGSQAKQPSHHQENVQRSSVPQSASGQQTPTRTQQSSYPASSNGLSGTGGYPQQQGGHSGAGAAPPPYSPGGNNYGGNYGGNYHHPAPPPPYSPNYGGHGGYGAPGGYGGYGGHGGYGGYGGSYSPQMPGYFGNYGNKGYGGVSRGSNILTGVGIAGAGVGTILTGLALWNLARSTGRSHHTVIYDNSGQPVAVAPNNSTEPVVDPILGDLVNCTLTISNNNATEILGIPCAIATSFTPEADVKDAGIGNNPNDNTKCTVTVVTKAGKEFSTTIPCSTLLNTAAENNVTEPPLINNGSEPITGPMVPPAEQYVNVPVSPTALPLAVNGEIKNLNCTPEQGEVRDPINPCFVAANNLTVIPLASSDPVTSPTTAPSA